MIIYFEGLSCVGKTTYIEKLAEIYEDVEILSELPKDFQKHKNLDDFCRLNDERKCAESYKIGRSKNVFVDRGYASTLTYNYIQFFKEGKLEYLKTLEWYMKEITNGKLRKPDLYIYIDAGKEVILKRAKKLNRFTRTNAWYVAPQIGKLYYEYFFKFIEPDVPLLKIDGGRSMKQKVKIFQNYLDKNAIKISSK